ncbi:MAG: class I SAM-dependent methyltransferase [Acidimicrobiia bacterium]|nr:class I SAM-dependent methyltransferase [Acidimicrobiia bacterium]
MKNPGNAAERNDPLERHRIKSSETIASRDEAAIKRLYVELGRDYWDLAGGRSDYAIPVLSAPETLTTVGNAFRGTAGLVLDAGCGPNPAAAIALARDATRSIVALDIGWGMVRTAKSVAERQGLGLLAVAGDVERLPFREAAFDGLVCDDTIEHLPNDRAGVEELARVLRPGGRALLATPNRHSAAVLRMRMQDRMGGVRRSANEYFVASSHVREYTWPEFERLVGRSFVVDRRRPVGWHSGWKKRAITRLLWLPGVFRMSQMIVLQCHPRASGPT